MRNIFISKKLPHISKKDFWEYIVAIESYPEYIPFLTKTTLQENLSEGSTWYDVTRILWIPMKFKHTTLSFKPEKEMSFQVHIPFQGIMEQKYILKDTEDVLEIVAEAKFHLGNSVVDKLIGPILKRRLEKMMNGSLDNLQKRK